MNLLYEETMARIKIVSRTQTQTELAKLLEVRQSSVAEAKRRQSIPADWYLKLFEKLGGIPIGSRKATARYTCAQRPDTSPATGTGRL